MTEPPAKRVRRMDSSTMWDISDKSSKSTGSVFDPVDGPLRRDKDDSRRSAAPHRPERRQRSRSRERDDKRRERSKSRDRRNRDGLPRESRRDADRDIRSGRDRARSDSRQRDGRRDYYSKSIRYRERPRSKSRSRSRSPARNGTKHRTRSPPRGPRSERRDNGRRSIPPESDRNSNGLSGTKGRPQSRDARDTDVEMETDDMDQIILKTMGFRSFRTTQNTKIPGNNIYGVGKEKKTEYRQYMNRTGGFNRPLSPSR